MLGIKIFARGRISTVWPVPHYAGAAGAILVAQKRNYTKLISCLPRDVYSYADLVPRVLGLATLDRRETTLRISVP